MSAGSPGPERPRVCSVCGEGSGEALLDAGPQPVCSRYLDDPNRQEYAHPLVLGQCARCCFMRLIDPVPVEKLRPPHDWFQAIEPEGHLDRLADTLAGLPGLSKGDLLCGVSFKDGSLLKRLELKGYSRTWPIDPKGDLGIVEPNAGVETVQGLLTPETASRLTSAKGRPRLVIARHILEHAHDLPSFLGFLNGLVHPEGYVVIEIPDCGRSVDSLDYSTLWEEHVSYFTPTTFRLCLARAGFSLRRFEAVPYPLEDSLIALVQVAPAATEPIPEDAGGERLRALSFVKGLHAETQLYREKVSKLVARGEKIAVFGAGHLGGVFVNIHGLKDYIGFFADDHPRKQGLFMPGSRLPILGSRALLEEKISLCLLALSPESEEKVLAKNKGFVDRGGRFRSIFPSSAKALKLDPC